MVLQAQDQEGKADLLTLNDFSEDSVLHNVKKRFKDKSNIFS